ncbi:MAG: hypothetical protein AB8F74_05725, partial [Saprospiraceae bacterium]
MKKIHILHMIKRITFTLFLSLVLLSSINGQGWDFNFSIGSSGDVGNDVIHIPEFSDGKTFPVGLFSSDNSNHFHFSNITNEQSPGSASLFNPSGFSSMLNYTPVSSVMVGSDTTIVLSTQYDPETDKRNIYLSRYGTNPNAFPYELVWHQFFLDNNLFSASAAALDYTTDGELIILGTWQSEETTGGEYVNDVVLIKSNLSGQLIWTSLLTSEGDDRPVEVVTSPDGGYWLLKNVEANSSSADPTMWLVKTDVNGLLEWETNLGTNDTGYDMVATSDGGLAITGTNADEDLFVLKTDEMGFPLWRKDYNAPDRKMTGKGLVEDLQGNLITAGQVTFDANGEIDPFIAKLSSSGIALWERNYGKQDRPDGFNAIALTPGGNYLMGGYLEFENSPGFSFGLFAKTDTFGIIKGGLVHGNVFQDLNADCLPDTDEINLANWNVQVSNDSLNYFGNTDADGNYSIPVTAKAGDVTDYIVSIVPPSDYWAACANDIPIALEYLDTTNIDFSMVALIDCPFMEAQISNSNFRPCENANIYVQYCNTGTVTAEDAFIEITLDDYLSYNGATITPSVIDGQTYTFPTGDMAINSCLDFVISVEVSCDSTLQLGDALCIEASLFPDSLCAPPNQIWSGALLQLSYTCMNDSIQYQIENIGSDPTAQSLDYIIIEDAVLLLQNDFENLLPTDFEMPMSLPINGSSYHLMAEQEPGAPGPEWVSLGVMDCGEGPNSGSLNEVAQFVGGPFELIYCPLVVGSFDPNDKQAIPSGFGEDHFILPNTDIEYTIRFQNTGTDTAFRVVILDTLSQVLDPASIKVGSSSHPYEFRLLDEG